MGQETTQWVFSYKEDDLSKQWYAQQVNYSMDPPEKILAGDLCKSEAVALLSCVGNPVCILSDRVYTVEIFKEN